MLYRFEYTEIQYAGSSTGSNGMSEPQYRYNREKKEFSVATDEEAVRKAEKILENAKQKLFGGNSIRGALLLRIDQREITTELTMPKEGAIQRPLALPKT